jgi:transposase
MSRKLNQYSSEFKDSAIKLALEGDKSIGQTAVDLGIKKSTLYTWISKHAGPRVIVTKANDNEHTYDEEACRAEPLDTPFKAKLLPMSSE